MFYRKSSELDNSRKDSRRRKNSENVEERVSKQSKRGKTKRREDSIIDSVDNSRKISKKPQKPQNKKVLLLTDTNQRKIDHGKSPELDIPGTNGGKPTKSTKRRKQNKKIFDQRGKKRSEDSRIDSVDELSRPRVAGVDAQTDTNQASNNNQQGPTQNTATRFENFNMFEFYVLVIPIKLLCVILIFLKKVKF